MPRINLSRLSGPDYPPIDWLWAAVLERKRVYGYDLRKMAEIAGVSYETMRRYITISPWEWNEDARNLICKEFKLTPTRGVEVARNAVEVSR